MRNLVLLSFIIVYIGASSRAFAQKAEGQSENMSFGQDDSSAVVRAGKRFSVGYTLGNVAGGIPGSGLEGFYHLNRQWLIGFFGTQGRADFADEIDPVGTVSLEKAELGISMYAINVKYFVGNSFFVRLGLGRRSIDSDLKVVDSASTQFLKLTTESDSVVTLVSLGNVWAWDNGFFIGADWIGVSVPLSSSYKFKIEHNFDSEVGSEFAAIEEDGRSLSKKMGESTAAMFLVLNLGYSF